MTTKQPGSSEEEWFARREGELKHDGVLRGSEGSSSSSPGESPAS